MQSNATSSFTVVGIPAHPDDRWRLTDPYVEEVWSEFIGPTATLLARRLGRLVELRPAGIEIELGDLASSIGVSPSVARQALVRLDRFEVLHCDLERAIVGVSGYAPSVSGSRLLRLSEAGRTSHDRLATAAGHDTLPSRATASFRVATREQSVSLLSLDR